MAFGARTVRFSRKGSRGLLDTRRWQHGGKDAVAVQTTFVRLWSDVYRSHIDLWEQPIRVLQPMVGRVELNYTLSDVSPECRGGHLVVQTKRSAEASWSGRGRGEGDTPVILPSRDFWAFLAESKGKPGSPCRRRLRCGELLIGRLFRLVIAVPPIGSVSNRSERRRGKAWRCIYPPT